MHFVYFGMIKSIVEFAASIVEVLIDGCKLIRRSKYAVRDLMSNVN